MGGQNKNKANSISTEIALTELGNEKIKLRTSLKVKIRIFLKNKI